MPHRFSQPFARAEPSQNPVASIIDMNEEYFESDDPDFRRIALRKGRSGRRNTYWHSGSETTARHCQTIQLYIGRAAAVAALSPC